MHVMAGGNPRDNVKGKGFWDGGAAGHSTNSQSAGRPSGFPGRRVPQTVGIGTDVEFPPDMTSKQEPKK
jgi:hypothetical protein